MHTVPVKVTEQDEMYHGELTSRKVWHAEVVWPSQDPMALTTMSVLGRGDSAAEAVADWTRRAQADGHDVTGQLSGPTNEAEDEFDEEADVAAWHVAEDFISLCAEHGLDPRSSEAGRIHDEVKDLVLKGTTAAALAERYRVPVADVEEILGNGGAGVTEAADELLPDPTSVDEAAEKFIVWIREKGQWVENGDGPMGKATADRVAREVAKDFKIGTKVLPAGTEPPAR